MHLIERFIASMERSRYEENPTVFPVLDGDNLVGTCFIWKTRRNNCFVISRSLHARRDYTCLIPVEEGNKQKIFKIGLNRGKEGADFVATAVKNHPRVPNFVESSNISDAGRQIYMVSRKVHCKICGKLQTNFISKFCQVKKDTKYGYNYNKNEGGGFKDFPYGAPVVNDKNQVVGIVKKFQEDGKYFEVVDFKELKFHVDDA